MNQPSPLFKVVSEEPEASPQAAQQQAVAITMIQIALSAVWKQAIIAVAHLFTLLSVASAFVLWLMIPDPNTHQLIAMGMFATFILAANLLVIWSRRNGH